MLNRRIFLHVGSPKTGTTFLQQVLWSHRALAKEQGLLLPLGSFHDHFLASLDVRDLTHRKEHPARAKGIWAKAVDEAAEWPGHVLISHELFAGATTEQAERAIRAWGDEDVHVIVTARDLERQIPAEWQEHLKHRSSLTLTQFIDKLKAQDSPKHWFWTVQDYAGVCRRWGTLLPPGNVHVVTVPPRQARPDQLWERFAGLLELDPGAYDLATSRANLSLRAEQAELLRRTNGQLGTRLPIPGPYPPTVKEVFAQTVLTGRPGTVVALMGDDKAFAAVRSQRLVDELEQLGVDVVGDLADLVPADTQDRSNDLTAHPEHTSAETLLDEGLEAIVSLLERASTERVKLIEANKTIDGLHVQLHDRGVEIAELQIRAAELVELRAEHDRLVHDMRYRPVRHLFIGLSERLTWLMKIRVGYWRTVNLARAIWRRVRHPRRGG